ncbi:MAG: DUF2938 family protein [Gammaproteobacteria bacterium]
MTFIGGLVGASFMDITESYLSKLGINSGVNGTYIAKWVHGLARGQFYHSNIDNTPALDHEFIIAALFHYIIGGGAVALGYAVLISLQYAPLMAWHIPLSIAFGLMTCMLPWFILMPAIGKGVLGTKMAMGAKPVLAPILSHIAYGLGIGITLFIYDVLTA